LNLPDLLRYGGCFFDSEQLAKELPMKTTGQDDEKVAYKTPRWVQVWFLQRSRNNWKKKYMKLKTDMKRVQNRVNDVSKSREKWHGDSQELEQRVRELDARNTALQEQLEALKKDGRATGPRSLS
jgi:septal ring factor EnvC (AmiA/AmiB activator)